jgi:hypothetical protein
MNQTMTEMLNCVYYVQTSRVFKEVVLSMCHLKRKKSLHHIRMKRLP